MDRANTGTHKKKTRQLFLVLKNNAMNQDDQRDEESKQGAGSFASRMKVLKRGLLRGTQLVKEKVGIVHNTHDEEFNTFERNCHLLEIKTNRFIKHVNKMVLTFETFSKQYHDIMSDFDGVLIYGDVNEKTSLWSNSLMNAAYGKLITTIVLT
jgi:hypothetical protein